jgi:hypothetical protein
MTALPILATILTIALAIGLTRHLTAKRRRLAPLPVRIR